MQHAIVVAGAHMGGSRAGAGRPEDGYWSTTFPLVVLSDEPSN